MKIPPSPARYAAHLTAMCTTAQHRLMSAVRPRRPILQVQDLTVRRERLRENPWMDEATRREADRNNFV